MLAISYIMIVTATDVNATATATSIEGWQITEAVHLSNGVGMAVRLV
jgi:hypothetical protein